MLQFLMYLFSFHGATEIEYTADDEQIKECRDCLKEIKLLTANQDGRLKKQIIAFSWINYLLGCLCRKTIKQIVDLAQTYLIWES